MSAVEFIVTVASGTLQSESSIVFPHQWTDGGVSVEAAFTGGHLFHLAPAGCILNDVHREAVLARVDSVAEIPKAMRSPTQIARRAAN